MTKCTNVLKAIDRPTSRHEFALYRVPTSHLGLIELILFLRVTVGRLKLGFAVDQRNILTVHGQFNSQIFIFIM